MKRTFILRSDAVLAYMASELARYMRDGIVPQCDVKPFDPTRTLDQNAKFHAMVDDIARTAKYMGRELGPESWKALFVSGHSIATKQGGEVLPGLEGEFVAIRESTARMGKKRASSLIEYVMAWAAMNGIQVNESEPIQ